MLLNVVDNLGKLAATVVGRLLPPKIGEAERRQLQMKAEVLAKQLVLDEQSGFRQFVLEYEGRAKDMPRFIQVLRGSVRPVLTYLFGLTTLWLYWRGQPIPQELFQLDLVMFAFWFGERAVRNYIKTKQGRDHEVA